MPIGTTRKPQALTRKNATPASGMSPLTQASVNPAQSLAGLYSPGNLTAAQAALSNVFGQRVAPQSPFNMTPGNTAQPLAHVLQGNYLVQGRTPSESSRHFSALQGLTDSINAMVQASQSGQLTPRSFPPPPASGPNNWRYPTQSPLVRSPVANRQSMLAGQASTITGMQQAEKAGLGWMLPGNGWDMPTFVARNRPEDVMAEFVATHMDGLRDKALSRVPSGPLTLRTPGGQLQQQMGYIDGQGQMTATNRLGALRQLAMQNPNDADVMGALAAAENDFKAQLAHRSSPATVAANQGKISARNDAKRERAQRQAEGLRNLFGYGPRSPLSKKQMSDQQANLQSPLTAPGTRTIESQSAADQNIKNLSVNPHIANLGVEYGSGVVGLDTAIHDRLREDPDAGFTDDSLKAYQQWAQNHAEMSTAVNDYFSFTDMSGGTTILDMEKGKKWKELASLPDNPRAREKWMTEYRNLVATPGVSATKSFSPDTSFGIYHPPGGMAGY